MIRTLWIGSPVEGRHIRFIMDQQVLLLLPTHPCMVVPVPVRTWKLLNREGLEVGRPKPVGMDWLTERQCPCMLPFKDGNWGSAY